MRKFLHKALIVSATAFAVLPHQGFAQSSDWLETLGARMRVHLEPQNGNTSWRAALDIELEEGWNSYWLDPGYNGIPPQISVTGHSGTDIASKLVFQTPQLLGDGEKRYAGYLNRFALGILPVSEGTLPKKIDVFLGLCREICVPFQASFELKTSVSESAQKLSTFYVNKAFEKMPEDLGAIEVEAVSDTIEVNFPSVQQSDYTLIVSELDGWVFEDITQIHKTTDSVRFSAKVTQKGHGRIPTLFSLSSEDKAHQYGGVLQLVRE